MARSPFAPPQRRGHGSLLRFCIGCARIGSQLIWAMLLLGLLAGGLTLARLAEGPVAVPMLSAAVERLANARLGDARLSLGRAVVGLREQGGVSGLVFEDVRIVDPGGTELIEAPQVAGRFLLSDLLQGQVRPTAITLIRPRIAMLRARDGRIRAGIGIDDSLPPTQVEQVEAPSLDAVARIIDGFVGDAPPPPGLSRLQTILVRDAALIYEDARNNRIWRTRGSDLRLTRTADGAEAEMRAALTEAGGATATVTLSAARLAGTGRTHLHARFDGLQGDAVAEQLAETGWTRLIDAPLSGEIWSSIGAGGDLLGLAGWVTAADGRLLALPGRADRFDRLEIGFAWVPEDGRVDFDRLELTAPALSLSATGSVAPEGADPLLPDALSVRLDVTALSIDSPEHFARPLAFDGGSLAARVGLDPLRIDLDHARLGAGDMRLGAGGTAAPGPDGWQAGLDLSGAAITVPALKAHWPLGAGANARAWVAENIQDGVIPALHARLDLDAGAASLALGFRFRDVVSRYLGDMPPIEAGAGIGHLTTERFDLTLESGQVAAAQGLAPVALDGSHLSITDLDGEVTPGDITVRGRGETRAILALIDRPPLELVSKLGLDPASVAGRAQVTARLRFPLIDDLPIEEVNVAADAVLSDTRLAPPLGTGETVTAERLTLTATTEEMTVAGQARLAGTPLDIRWTEGYGAAPRRRVAVSGPVGPDLLAALGIGQEAFRAGTAAVTLDLTGVGADMDATLAADLSGAELAVPALGWSKPQGAPGRLDASARIGGDGLGIDRLALEAGGLAAEGSLRLDRQGRLLGAELTRFVLGSRAELSAGIDRGGDGMLQVALEGPWLDLSDLVADPPAIGDEGGDGDTPALRLDARIERLRLTPAILLSPARAALTRDAGGAINLDLTATAGEGRFEARYARPPGAPGTLDLTAPDAGALLGGLGLFAGGRGGTLALDARLAPEPGVDIAGRATIRDMVVQGAPTVGQILEEGGAGDAAEAVEQGGLAFDSIRVPFSYADGVLTLDEAIARSPLLAVKVQGTVAEADGALSLGGVISPAYALTGALDNIPLLGTLLSGGRGEGIVAMTFRVGGTLDAPAVTVNPLSLLTPGVLRGVFSGESGTPSDRFLEGLERGG